jgi:competence protein ComEC
MLLFAAAVAGGIFAETRIPFGCWGWGIVLAGTLVLGGGALVWGQRRLVSASALWLAGAALLAGISLGGLRYATDQTVPPEHVVHWTMLPNDAPALVVLGRVATDPAVRPRSTRFVLAAEAVVAGTDTIGVAGRVQVTLRPSPWGHPVPFPLLESGDRVALTGQLRPPRGRRNPAGMDYGGYLERRGIHATMTAYDGEDVALVGRERSRWARIVAEARSAVRGQLHRHVPSAEARAVLSALVLGDRSGLDVATRDRFARTGLMHLLAVSGLHVLLVGMVVYRLLQPLLLRLSRRRLRWRTVEGVRVTLTLTLLLGYLLLSGVSTSATRAVVMAGLLLGGAVLHRAASPLNTLGVAALVLLLWRPGALFDVGFQLSFAAVAAIVTVVPRLEDLAPQTWTAGWARRHAWEVTAVSFAATLGTAPVLLYHFGYASAAGLVLNLAAIPLTGLALGSAFAMIGTSAVSSTLAAGYGAASDGLVDGLLWITKAGEAALGWAAVEAFVQDPWLVAAMVAGLVACAQWPRPRLRWRWLLLSLVLVTGSVWAAIVQGAHRPQLDVVFFDVGHGDAALLRLPNGRHLLIDAGARGPTGDHGTHTILPHLERYGIDRLDAVLVSHPHGDHLGGVPALLRTIPISQFITSGTTIDSELFAETRHLIDSTGVPHRTAQRGDTLHLDPSVRLQVLAPDPEMRVSDNANDASIVLRVVYGRTTLLFTGDAERDAEAALVRRYGSLLRSDVVKVGHHGSSTSSTVPFVAAATRDSTRTVAVISAGTHGVFDLPRPEIVRRWDEAGAVAWTTKDGGALWLRSDGDGIERVRWR